MKDEHEPFPLVRPCKRIKPAPIIPIPNWPETSVRVCSPIDIASSAFTPAERGYRWPAYVAVETSRSYVERFKNWT